MKDSEQDFIRLYNHSVNIHQHFDQPSDSHNQDLRYELSQHNDNLILLWDRLVRRRQPSAAFESWLQDNILSNPLTQHSNSLVTAKMQFMSFIYGGTL
ncbi:MAG: hypothetical protein AAF153_03060 [Pseudomonadota bacterium]